MRNSLFGWKEVFQFTFVQNMKSKSIKISTLIICLIAMAVFPVMTLINGTDDSLKTETSIKKIYVVDNTGKNLINDLEVLKADTYYKSDEVKLYTNIEYIDKTEEILNKASEQAKQNQEMDLKEVYTFDENDIAIYLEINLLEEKINVSLIYNQDTKISKNDVEDYNQFVGEHFEDVLLSNQNISEEKMDIIHSYQEVEFHDELNSENIANPDKKNEERGDGYWLNYTLSMVILMMLAFGGQRIAVSIIVEKSSKIMEYLMTSIKPMAVVIGKVLANLLILLVQFIAIFVSIAVSVVIAGFMNSEGTFKMPSMISNVLKSGGLNDISPINLIIAILIIMAGFLFFGMLAALSGAAVSKMDEISEGVKIYTFVMLIGAYLSLFVISGRVYMDESFVKYLACLLPISAPFIAPGTLISSYLSTIYGLLSLGILIVAIILLTKFVANVYESMIYYSGTPLKMKDIITISKQNRKSAESDSHVNGKEEQ